ncbi:MAG: glycosyltransferase family 4 protein [Planctomycetota bacterium]
MKLAFLIEHFDPSRGGAETYVAQFADGCARRGHEVHIVARSGDAGALPAGVTLHRIPAASLLPWRKFDRNANEVMQELGADIVLGTGKTTCQDVLQPHGGVYRASLRQNGALATGTATGLLRDACELFSWKRRCYLSIEKQQYASSDTEFIAVSRMVKSDMMRYYAVPEERIHVIYNGVDTTRFRPENAGVYREETRAALGAGPGDLVALLVAHNSRLKGVRCLLQAVAALADKVPARAVIVGKGKAKPYQRLAQALGIAERVRFEPSTARPEEYYAAADIYCHPTWYDPCSLVVLEALASGLPVITTRWNGAGELITSGREGYVMSDPSDHEELARLIRLLAEEPARRAAGAAARALALEHTLERNHREMIEILERAGEKARRKSPNAIP